MRRDLLVETPKGAITARAAIVTVSTNRDCLGRDQVHSRASQAARDAFGKLTLGSYDHIALELAGNPLGFESDDLVFEKSADAHTAAILANVSGTQLCMIEVAGTFGRDLAARGEAAMVDFAADWLAGLYGADVKKAIKRSHATRWNHEPLALGAFSAAAPGGQGARRIVAEPLQNTLWFAGEAVHETSVGHRWWRLGIRRTRRGRGDPSARTREGAAAGRFGATAAQAATGARAAATAGCSEGQLAEHHARRTALKLQARNTPPVRLPTSATIFAASASIS